MKKPSPKLWRGLICGAILAVTFASAMPVIFGENAFESSYAANEKKISTLTEQVSQLEKTDGTDAATMNKDMYSASEAGRAVADLQSKYQTINAETTPDLITQNSDSLSQYFTDDAQNARTPWFTVSKGDGKAVWEFETTYSFKDKKVPVIWLCHLNGTDNVLAYATATYDAKTNKFSDVQTHTTGVGSAYVDGTGDTSENGVLSSLIDKIKSQDTSGDDASSTPESDQEAQDQVNARAWLKDHMEKEGDK